MATGKSGRLQAIGRRYTDLCLLDFLLNFLAAAGQARGFFLLRPLMAQGIDPIAALAVRVAIAAVA